MSYYWCMAVRTFIWLRSANADNTNNAWNVNYNNGNVNNDNVNNENAVRPASTQCQTMKASTFIQCTNQRSHIPSVKRK